MPRPERMSITVAQLTALAPHCDAEVLALALSKAADERDISTPLQLVHFLSQQSVESMGFTVFVENLSYSAQRLCQVWPGRFPNLIAAHPFEHDPEKLAERTYGGRLGNSQPGDGFRFRGRGTLQITGRENYQKYGEIIGVDLIAEPDKAAWPTIAPRIAAAYWASHHLNPLADKDDVLGITLAINGGRTGLADREAAVAKAKHILGV